MEAQLELIRDQQKETWNTFSPGWRKWDEFTMNWLRPMGDELIRTLSLKETDNVLDVAAGTGEPGLTVASLVPRGHVTITDLAEGMLDVARDNADRRQITNTRILACDVSELPFEDESFDAVSCRLGFMYFPDMLQAALEMVRVLKPGGKLAAAVWSTPDKNFWITASMSTINGNLHLSPPPAGAPGMFRCGNPGFLAALLREAGLKNVTEKAVTGQLECGTNENYWNFMNDVVAPVVAALRNETQSTRDRIRRDVFSLLDQNFAGKRVTPDYGALVVSGQK